MAKHKVKMSEVVRSTQTVQASTERGGSKVDYMKLGPKVNKVLILPPWNGKDLMKRLLVHQVWKGRKPVLSATSPRIEDGADDPIMDYGFRLKEKYEDSPSKAKQDLWKKYMPSDSIVVNALDLSEDKPTPKVLRLPACAVKFLCDEVGEIGDGDQIWDLEKGLPLIIKGNGKNGNNRRYEYAKFSKNAAALVSEGRVDEDAILDNLFDLDKLQPKLDEKKLNKVLAALKQQDQAILSGGRGGDDEDEADGDDEDDTPRNKKKAKRASRDDDDEEESDDEADEADGDDDEDNDFEDDDEKPAKKKGKVAAKKSKRDDDDEDDEEEDSADDEDEDDEPRKKKKTKLTSVKGGKKSKRDDDDEDEEESDEADEEEDLDDEALDDDEEDEAPKKKPAKKAAAGLRKNR